MSDLTKNAAFDNLDDLLDASMDDIEGLPPFSIPPTGFYRLKVSAETGSVGKAGQEKEAVIFKYSVIELLEAANPEEANQSQAGMEFSENFILKGKDGKANEKSIGAMKNRIETFTKHFGLNPSDKGVMRETLMKIQAVEVTASVKRTPQKMEDGTLSDEFFNARVKDVAVV